MWVVVLLKRAEKALEGMDADTRERVVGRLEDLQNDPYKEKQLVAQKVRSARVGDYRILFHIGTPDRKVVVLRIPKRSRAYQR